MLLDIVDEMHLLQPSTNVQVSKKTPDALLEHALRVIRKGYGFPSLFNADAVVEEQVRQGKTLEDARAGGCSGCVETGAFGKEAFILTGYFNLAKVLEVTLHDGVDPRTGQVIGWHRAPGRARTRFATFDDLFAAYRRQLAHFLEIKIRGNQLIERLYAEEMPAPFLSVLIDDCIARGHGLQRRRRPLRQHLHPGGGDRHGHRLPGGAPAGRVRGRGAQLCPSWWRPSTPTSGTPSRCASASSTARRSTATTTSGPTS